MKRLTKRLPDGVIHVDFAKQKESVMGRLVTIEDILGDEYDLDRLSELSEADKEGRIVVLPKIPNCDTCPLCGEYGECKITGYPPNPEKCREVIKKEAALKEATL